MLAVMKVLNC